MRYVLWEGVDGSVLVSEHLVIGVVGRGDITSETTALLFDMYDVK